MNEMFKEARRLKSLGCAVLWLKEKSKMPVESGWTTGEAVSWAHLKETYREGYNVGIRLGEPSKIGSGYLAAIDVDVKSTEARHRKEAHAAAKLLLRSVSCPLVLSGRGGGSRHYYCLTAKPFKTFNPAASEEFVKAYVPSKKASKKDIAMCTPEEIEKGIRWVRAWEVSLYSNGRQVVAPPSIHPDTGRAYVWKVPYEKIEDLPVIEFDLPIEEKKNVAPSRHTDSRARGNNKDDDNSGLNTRFGNVFNLDDFNPVKVDVEWLPISDEVRAGIISGEGVIDRSGFLLSAAAALQSCGLSTNEVLSVLTDPRYAISFAASDRRGAGNRRSQAQWVWEYTVKKITDERDPVLAFKNAPPIGPRKALSHDEARTQAENIEAEKSWLEGLVKGPKGAIIPSVGNVVHILKNDVGGSLVKRNLFAFRDTYSINTPWGGKRGEIVSDDDVANLKYWLGQRFGIEPKKDVLFDALTVIACQNAYDPVKDWLNDLPAWDGTERLDTWLRDNFEAKGHKEYLAQVFRKWMVAMVMRAYHPGAKFDWMPIFEGAQGVGKSSFGRLLVGDKHFLDWLPNLNDKDSALSLQGMWGVEMGELPQFRRNELEVIKAFITRTVDKFRPPHGRKLMESPRRCVFFGTTNRSAYLIDDTGNRRFKPCEVGSLNFKALKKDRLQLFAEAKMLFEMGVESERTLELTGEAKVYEKEIHAKKMVEDESDVMLETMRNFLEKVGQGEVDFNTNKFRIANLFEGRGALVKWPLNDKNTKFAVKMVKKLGAEYKEINGLGYWKLSLGRGNFDSTPTQTLN